MKIVRLHNFRRGLATNSSSTHSLIYRNEGELFDDLNIFELNYYDRYDETIAASREAKIKYVLAAIMYNQPLVKIMSSFYPEMKEYYPLIKERFQTNTYEGFGMCARGNLDFNNNLEASVDYLRHVIDNNDIIIIGGSDEADFVHDHTEGHVECPDPDELEYAITKNKKGVNKNGNYWVGFGRTRDLTPVDEEGGDERIKNSFHGKIRFSTSDTDILVPEYPELIDLKITNMCAHGCPMCFVNATRDGAHADIRFLKSAISSLRSYDDSFFHRTEFSIGGGNILAYPDLEELLQFIHEQGHIVNVTIKSDDCVRVLRDEPIREVFKKYVDGIGISVFNAEDAKRAIELRKANMKDDGLLGEFKHIILHVIPEYIGVDAVEEIAKVVSESKTYMGMLYLGYKTNGRGADQAYKILTTEELDKLFNSRRMIEIDTTFANRYFDYISKHFACAKTLTRNEGEFSMYIDGVEQNAYKSSYDLDKPYNMSYVPYAERERNPMYNIREAFKNIRKDCGFMCFSDLNEHYYD